MQIKCGQLLKHYCKIAQDIKLGFFFATFKVRNRFSVKDSVLQSLSSHVVYKFTCAGCNACYTGETTRHICTCVCEFLVLEKASHVYKHLQSSRTRCDSCSAEPFAILELAASSFQVKIKKALYITCKWEI